MFIYLTLLHLRLCYRERLLSSLHLTKKALSSPIFHVHQPDLLMEFNIQINVMQTTYFSFLDNTLGHPDPAVYVHGTFQRPQIIFNNLKKLPKC